jgi:hypothetical protein
MKSDLCNGEEESRDGTGSLASLAWGLEGNALVRHGNAAKDPAPFPGRLP